MISLKILIVVLGVIGGGGALVVNGIWGPRARARRRLARGPRQFVEGEVVTLVGRVRAIGEPLLAPFSGRRCVAYDVSVILRDPNSREAESFVQSKLVPFELVTDDGTILVEGELADFALPIAPVIPRKLEREQAFVESIGRDPMRAAHGGFEEAVVEEGDQVAVQGMAVLLHVADGDNRGYRESPLRVKLVEQAGHRITIGRP